MMIRQSTHKYHSYMLLQFYEINAMPLGVIGYYNSIYGHNLYKLRCTFPIAPVMY